MKSSKLRTVTAAVVFVVLCIGLIVQIGFGTLSGFGWDAIAALCPLGAITTMIATRMVVPRAVVSIIVMAILVFVVGRAFCGWVCPVPLLERIKNFFRSPKKRKEVAAAARNEALSIAKSELGCSDGADCGDCTSCKQMRKKFDSRHYVLGGSILSVAIFGFPVFCLVCPVGLTFATVLVWWRLFANGDMTWSVVLIPAMLVIEIVFLRKWCSRFCPMSGLMNLVSRFGKTFRPTIDDSVCLETTKGAACSRCAIACDADINLRHPDFGEHTLADCTRCRACVDACPTHAISMPFLPPRPTFPRRSGGALEAVDAASEGADAPPPPAGSGAAASGERD